MYDVNWLRIFIVYADVFYGVKIKLLGPSPSSVESSLSCYLFNSTRDCSSDNFKVTFFR